MKIKLISFIVFAIVLFPFASADLSDHLIAYYDFEQSSGDLIDFVDGEHNGTEVGVTRDIDGILGNGWKFNSASNSLVNITKPFGASQDLNFSWQAWVNVTSGEQSGTTGTLIGIGNDTDVSQFQRIYVGTSGQIVTEGFSSNIANGTDIDNSNWNHIVLTGDGTFLRLYVNGSFVAKVSSTPDEVDRSNLGAVVRSITPETFYNGRMDEVAVYNRTLTADEVLELYNDGEGLDPTQLKITLNSPANNSNLIGLSKTFNATLEPRIDRTLRNATLFVWNSSDDLVTNPTKNITGESSNESIFEDINLTTIQEYKWNVLGCENSTSGDINCVFASSNFTFNINAFQVISNIFDDPVLETSSQRFELNISINPGFSLQNTKLIYNGTENTGVDSNEFQDNNFSLSKTINLPAIPNGTGSQNITFFWNLTTANQTSGTTSFQTTDNFGQNVTELILDECGISTLIHPVLNFTMKDEFNGSIISAQNLSTFQSDFNYGATSDNLIKNFSTNNITESTPRYDFCTNNETNIFFTDMNAFYTAENYADSNHFLNNATLNGSKTNSIDLFLLKEGIAIQFFVTIKNDLIPIDSAFVNIAKFFPGEGVYKTVEIDKTDDSGKISVWLELDKQYKFTIIDSDGDILGISDKTAICEEAPCKIQINLATESQNPFQGFDSQFATNVIYNLSYNPETQIVTFDFVDTTGLATYFNLRISRTFANQTAEIISNQTLFTSSGQITFNMSAQPDGDYIAEAFVSRSPIQFIDFITFLISEGAKTIGIIGLFLALIIIMCIIFGISISPEMLILVVPLSLTFTRWMGFISLSNAVLIAIWIISLAAFMIIKR